MKNAIFLHFCPSPPIKYLYYSFDHDENLHKYEKSKIKWGNCKDIFSIFFIEKKLFKENVKRGRSAVYDRMYTCRTHPVEEFQITHTLTFVDKVQLSKII